MVGRLSLTLFTVLFLFGCASSNKNEAVPTEQVVDKKDFASLKNFEIHNQKDAVKALGEPIEKIITILEWNPRNKEYLEYVEIWKWKNAEGITYIVFNKKGEFHNKIQIIMFPTDYDKKLLKSLKHFPLNKKQ